MTSQIREVSTITAKGQTTVPKAVRQALGVSFGGRIAFHIDETGVSVSRADADEADPAIESFLAFLAKDIETRPEAISDFPSALVNRIADLTRGMKIDLDEEIDGDVDL